MEECRGRLPVVLIIAGGLALTACASTSLPKPGGGAPALGPVAAVEMRSAPVKGDSARFAFTRITGAPGDLLTTLSDSLNKEAKARKLTVVPEDDATATYKVKGYVSAESGRRIYYAPGSRFYEEASPERCYASEDDARRDGSRPAHSPGPRWPNDDLM